MNTDPHDDDALHAAINVAKREIVALTEEPESQHPWLDDRRAHLERCFHHAISPLADGDDEILRLFVAYSPDIGGLLSATPRGEWSKKRGVPRTSQAGRWRFCTEASRANESDTGSKLRQTVGVETKRKRNDFREMTNRDSRPFFPDTACFGLIRIKVDVRYRAGTHDQGRLRIGWRRKGQQPSSPRTNLRG